MSLRDIKLFFGLFILLAYIGIGVFGLVQFSHKSETPMVNCPYAQGGSSLCENSFSHIANWQQFFNITFPALFLLSLLALGLAYFDKSKFLIQISRTLCKWKYYLNSKKLYAYPQKITKWLSLFENSPSLAFAVQS